MQYCGWKTHIYFVLKVFSWDTKNPRIVYANNDAWDMDSRFFSLSL